MDVNFGYFCLDCPANIQVSIAIKVGMYATLKANFRSTPLPSFKGSVCNFIIGNQIGFTSQVLFSFAFGEGTEVTGIFTDIGVIDISCDYITDSITIDFCLRALAWSSM